MDAAPADAVLAAVRALHFAATILLFGQFVYATAVSPGRWPPRFFAIAATSLVVLFASALAWLGLEAISMSGLPASEALSAPTLGTVLTATQFGRVWLARMVLCGALVVLAAALPGRAMRIPGLALSAILLGALSAMGHAASGRGTSGVVHLASDAAHLVAAGAWLGALVPLVLVLGRGEGVVDATRRFSTLGVAAMAVILASGIANSLFLVPTPAALVGSAYGRLLCAKIALFAIVLAIAAVNRQRLTPRLSVSLPALRRNAIVECCLGFAIVAIVGQLGITMPAAQAMGR